MAWPIDAKDVTYAPLTPVPSDNLNEIQDRIVDLHRVRKRVFFDGFPAIDGSSNPAWGVQSSRLTWDCKAGGATSYLTIPIQFQGQDAIVVSVEVKYRIATAVGLQLALYEVDHHFDVAATAPALNIIGSVFTSSGGSPPDWRIHDGTGTWAGSLPVTISEEESLILAVADPDLGDEISGVWVEYQPITPTP